MKKYLIKICLCAALAAMLAGLGVASADFKDEDTITYKIPVGVMHGAGILSGYMDGTFNPTGSITREEAVKMIAFAVIGEQGVMDLPRMAPGFSDMDADRWSAPYVYWAVENGVIVGVGDGRFNPSGKVTGYQLVKMMLCATGYGQKGEYSGPSWEVAAAKDGFAKGIFANITDADPSRSVTREEAALYIFNGITRLEQVSYYSKNNEYRPKDGTQALDNTIAAQIYGIVEADGKETVFHDIVSQNSVNGDPGITVLGERPFEYATGLELLGHRAVAYTNGEPGLKNRVYYIGDESQTVTLKVAVDNQKRFEEAFGTVTKISDKLTVYNSEAVLTEAVEIEGFDPDSFKAPAGSYVFYGDELISYMAPVPQYVALVERLNADGTVIGGVEYAANQVVGLEECKLGDVVIARMLAGRLFVSPAKSFTGRLLKTEVDYDGGEVYFFSGFVFLKSEIEDRTDIKSVSTVVGSFYTVFYDDNYRYITIVNGQ